MSEPAIYPAQSPAEIDAVRGLFRAYGRYLTDDPNGAASICIDGLEREIAGLPGAYLALFLATVEGYTAGCVALKPITHKGEEACELKRLWVLPSFRGHRLGGRLMRAAIEHAVLTGFPALYLDTVPTAMPEANRLYERFGFERVERYNSNPVADVVFYRLSLLSTDRIVPGAENPSGFGNRRSD